VVDREGSYVRDCAPGESGVITVKGPGVVSGYVDASLDRGLFFPDGWLNTGDLGHIDEDGYLWVTGRIKDLIIRGGHNIDASIIDNTLLQHPAVELTAAVGKPDAYAGELPVAYVQLKPGALATPEELREFARANIEERGTAPVEVRILEKMPLTDVGKLYKPPLRLDAAQRAFREALGSSAADVEVVNDPTRGMHARVMLAAAKGSPDTNAEAEVRSVMDRYTMAYEVVWRK
jgi:fatty-acyl-CoA synthase